MRSSSNPSRRPFEAFYLPALLAILLTAAPARPAAAAGSPPPDLSKAARAGAPNAPGRASTANPAKGGKGAGDKKKVGRTGKGAGSGATLPLPAAARTPPPILPAGGGTAEIPPADGGVGQTLADYIRARRATESRIRDRVANAALALGRGRRLTLWHPAYRRASAPLHAALDEALRALATGWGPYTRNVGFAVQAAIARLRRGSLFPAPDPLVDADLARSLEELETGAVSCQQGMQTTAQLHLLAGRRWLARAEARLPPPNRPETCPSQEAKSRPTELNQEEACRYPESNRSGSLPEARVGG